MSFLELGAVPCGESCAQVGSEDYQSKAMAECRRYKEQLEKLFPDWEINGCRFGVKGFSHDFGTYYEVVIYYDDNGVEFAFNVEGNLPETWE